jgi:hypothetical protein
MPPSLLHRFDLGHVLAGELEARGGHDRVHLVRPAPPLFRPAG